MVKAIVRTVAEKEEELEKGRGKDLKPRKKRGKDTVSKLWHGQARKLGFRPQRIEEYHRKRESDKYKSIPLEEPFEKARPHKYIRRLGAKGQYSYVYQEPFQREAAGEQKEFKYTEPTIVFRNPVQAALFDGELKGLQQQKLIQRQLI